MKGLKGTYREKSDRGVVTVCSARFEPNFNEPGTVPDTYCLRFTERGTRRDRGHLVSVARRKVGGTWTPWEETHRPTERALPPPKTILPALTDAERDAWADLAWRYVSTRETVGLYEFAGLLPGWDDVNTFDPGRTPAWGSPPMWPNFDYPTHARARAYAVAGMALRRLVQQGRAVKFAGTSAWGRKE